MTTLREELERLYSSHGKLTPQIVLTAAKSEKSPLHMEFDWDDSEAARKWRLEQAHRLITRVKIRYVEGDNPRDVRAWVAVPQQDSKQPTYEPAEKVAQDEFARRIVLNEMEREWRSLKRRYEQFEEFTQLVLGDLGAA